MPQDYQDKVLASILEKAASAHIPCWHQLPNYKCHEKDQLLVETKTKPVDLESRTGVGAGRCLRCSQPQKQHCCSAPHLELAEPLSRASRDMLSQKACNFFSRISKIQLEVNENYIKPWWKWNHQEDLGRTQAPAPPVPIWEGHYHAARPVWENCALGLVINIPWTGLFSN